MGYIDRRLVVVYFTCSLGWITEHKSLSKTKVKSL